MYFRARAAARLYFAFPMALLLSAAAAATLALSADTLRSHVEFLAGLPEPRNPSHPASLRQAHDYIRERFEAMGFETSLQEFQVAGRGYVNVVAVLNPRLPKVRVLGAHYDVCGEQRGADDNASGIAGLLEVARPGARPTPAP
jgi:acetylornithine deacetylase/succinyl-diaminopimelate desuccinylase-like protein